MRLAKTTALIACLAAAFLGGCGSSGDKGKQIPAAARVELDKQLSSIKGRFNFGGAGACSDIAQNKSSVQRTLDSLPSSVDSDVKNALTDGFNRLFQLTDSQCDEKKGQQTQTQSTESAPPPATTPSAPETTPTTPSDTTPTPTTPTTPQQKPKTDKGTKGNGGGNSAPQSGNGGAGASPGELP
jgi:hypothetical protein